MLLQQHPAQLGQHVRAHIVERPQDALAITIIRASGVRMSSANAFSRKDQTQPKNASGAG